MKNNPFELRVNLGQRVPESEVRKALATGEFIEEQIFNWTYTDEQRAKEEFAAKNPSNCPYQKLRTN